MFCEKPLWVNLTHVRRHQHLVPSLRYLRTKLVADDLRIVKIPGYRTFETRLLSPGSREKCGTDYPWQREAIF